ncbi:stAR-related lipid transfer protein 5-like [Liolophura sinensis]|uniref:stAR-related lipid transfer protein 5-like n=1 Tax=Liolophura sinensis TaxID=3198878 RepID=UPI0031582075
MDYQNEAAKTVEKMTSYRAENSDEWKTAKKHKDVTVFVRPSKEFGGSQYKVEGIVNAPPETVFEYVDPKPGDSKRMKWDKNVKNIEAIEELGDDMRIIRVVTSSALMGVISSRDFIDVVKTVKNDDFISTNAVSIEHPKGAVDSKYVRGWNYPSCLTCMRIPGEPNKTRMVNFLQPDLSGMLPRSIVESAMPGSQVEFFENLRNCLKEDGKLTAPHD